MELRMINCHDCKTFYQNNPCKSWAGGDICDKFEQVETRTPEQVKKSENRKKRREGDD
jgi:hypothetical protein